MAEVKWIKITTGIFDDDKMKIIDRMPARDEILVIWFKLLALAGKVNEGGLLFLNNRIAYTTEMLSAVFNREENTVKMAFKIFETYGMVHIEENSVIAITNWEKHQNVDGLDKMRKQNALRQERHREKQKQLSENNVTVTLLSQPSNAIDIELELELDLEKEKREKKKPKELKTFLPDSVEVRASEYLWGKIFSNNPDAKKPNIQLWAKEFDLMMRVDNRSQSDIGKVIDFCQSDRFWKSNILSAKKLREKYDQLKSKMINGGSSSNHKKGSVEELKEWVNGDIVREFMKNTGGDK